MSLNPASAGFDTYEFNIAVFENVQLEDLLQLLNKFNKAIYRAGTMALVEISSFLNNILHG